MLMNKDENKRIFDMVLSYIKAYQECPQSHRKIARLLKIKDWEAFNCQRAMEDLESFDEEKIKTFSLRCEGLTNIEKLMKDNEISRYAVRYLLCIIEKCVGYIYNDDFFSRDNPESFYWAGFIAADGCIDTYGNSLIIELCSKDKSHLEKFKIAIKSNNPIVDRVEKRNNKEYFKSRICITCKKIKKDLERFNISPRKTNVYYMPDWLVSHSLLHHFIRGYFDGDGSFFIAKNSNSLTFSLCGIERFLQQCQKIFNSVEVLSSKTQSKGETKHLYEIQHRGTNVVRKLFDYIYFSSSEINRLDRKYKLSKDYLDNKKLEKQNNTKGQRISIAKTGKHPFRGSYKITQPNGKNEIIKSLRKYCIENNLNSSSMFGLSMGKIKEYKGYKCERLKPLDE